MNRELFGIELYKTIFVAIGIAVLYGGFLVAGLWRPEVNVAEQTAKRRSLFCLGLVITLLYFLLPNFLTLGMGGFWKTRLVLLPPLLWLSCSRVPSVKSSRVPSVKSCRYVLGAATLLLLSLNLGIVTSFVHRVNQDLRELTAGVDAVGHDRTILFNIYSPRGEHSAVNPLYHAGEYYCLESQNVNLSHPFTTRLHSIVRLHPQIEAGRMRFDEYQNQSLVEIIVYWDTEQQFNPKGFRTIFQRGKLKILERTEE